MATYTFEQAAGGLLGACLAVQPPGPGICTICCTGARRGFSTCYKCHTFGTQLRRRLEPITPISLSANDTQIYTALKQYKGEMYSDRVRRAQRLRLAGLLGLFLENHRWCIWEDGTPDIVTVVPSLRGRQGRHPLETVTSMITEYSGRVETVLAPGPGNIDRDTASANGFVCTRPDLVVGATILLVDDTVTTGARLQSAVAVLNDTGAADVRIVAIGRHVNPAYSESTELWAWTTDPANRWDPDTCIHCSSSAP